MTVGKLPPPLHCCVGCIWCCVCRVQSISQSVNERLLLLLLLFFSFFCFFFFGASLLFLIQSAAAAIAAVEEEETYFFASRHHHHDHVCMCVCCCCSLPRCRSSSMKDFNIYIYIPLLNGYSLTSLFSLFSRRRRRSFVRSFVRSFAVVCLTKKYRNGKKKSISIHTHTHSMLIV